MRVRSWRDWARFQNVIEMNVWEIPDPSTLQKVKILGVEFVAWEDLKDVITLYTSHQEVSEQTLDRIGFNVNDFVGYTLEDMARQIAREMLKKLLEESPEIAEKVAERSPGKRPVSDYKIAGETYDRPENWQNLLR